VLLRFERVSHRGEGQNATQKNNQKSEKTTRETQDIGATAPKKKRTIGRAYCGHEKKWGATVGKLGEQKGQQLQKPARKSHLEPKR